MICGKGNNATPSVTVDRTNAVPMNDHYVAFSIATTTSSNEIHTN
jgi:hypothetical protein